MLIVSLKPLNNMSIYLSHNEIECIYFWEDEETIINMPTDDEGEE